MKVKCEFCDKEFDITSGSNSGYTCSIRCTLLTFSELVKGFIQLDWVTTGKEDEDERNAK